MLLGRTKSLKIGQIRLLPWTELYLTEKTMFDGTVIVRSTSPI